MGGAIKEAAGLGFAEPEMPVDPAERYMFENIGEERTPLLVFVNKVSGWGDIYCYDSSLLRITPYCS